MRSRSSIRFGSLPEAPFFWRGGLTKRALPQDFFFWYVQYNICGRFCQGEVEKNGESKKEEKTAPFGAPRGKEAAVLL
jgi:hypothetical protein